MIEDGGMYVQGHAGPEVEVPIGVEAADRPHQADMAFGDEIRRRPAARRITGRDHDDELAMQACQRVGRGDIVSIMPFPTERWGRVCRSYGVTTHRPTPSTSW